MSEENGAPSASVLIRGISAANDDNIDQYCGTGYNAFAQMGSTDTDDAIVFAFYN